MSATEPKPDTGVNADLLEALRHMLSVFDLCELTDTELAVMIRPTAHAILAGRRAVRKAEGANPNG